MGATSGKKHREARKWWLQTFWSYGSEHAYRVQTEEPTDSEWKESKRGWVRVREVLDGDEHE